MSTRSLFTPDERRPLLVLPGWARFVVVVVLGLSFGACVAPDEEGLAARSSAEVSPSPYAADLDREIKALSAEELTGYLEGSGMGFARVAEMNGYPGPLHVLELADDLDLSVEQQERTQQIFDDMKRRVQESGRQLVERERMLDRAFADGVAESTTTDDLLSEIGRLTGNIRSGHVQAHLALKGVLTEAQVRRYAELRGYSGSSDAAGADTDDVHGGEGHSHH